RSQRRLNSAIAAQTSEAIKNELPDQAVRPCPWISFDFDVQRSTVVWTCSAPGTDPDEDEQKTNCKAPKHGRPHIDWAQCARLCRHFLRPAQTRWPPLYLAWCAVCSQAQLRVPAIRRRAGCRWPPLLIPM